ncbi:hypothetical protein BKM15_26015 [Pseudomonas syringae pv. syringae]|nr:hypothetical protein BKM15_26015 [Pseudomonas syringae pv. syringae]
MMGGLTLSDLRAGKNPSLKSKVVAKKQSVDTKPEPDSADGKLTLGEKGPNVKILHDMLRALGHTNKRDDVFDGWTKRALEYFQKTRGLPVTGVYTSDVGEVMKKAILEREKDDTLYRVQVGAFLDEQNAEKLAAELKKKGYSAFIV